MERLIMAATTPQHTGVALDWAAGHGPVTGALSDEERRLKVDELSASPQRLLVATDCLSEGINLQEHFNAVIHYDLPWNPNRLEQREGRVDRFGQMSPTIKAVLMFGRDNPVDGAVLDVLLRKARDIYHTLGVPAHHELYDQLHRPHRVVPVGEVVGELLG